MSYEILRDKQFIKAEKDGKTVFFPMIYSGSNNCTQISSKGREIRERNWGILSYVLSGKKYGTLEEMIAFVENERLRVIENNKKSNEQYKSEGKESWCDEYSDERWGYFTAVSFGGGCKATFGQYKGFFITGCKKALTVEELNELGVPVNIHTQSFYYMKEKLKRYKDAGKEEINHYVKSSKELIEKLEEFEEYLKDFPKVSLYVTISADESEMKRIRRIKFPTKKNKPEYKEVNQYFVLHIASYGYFYGAKRNGFRYTPYKTSGKPFASMKAAENYKKAFSKRHSTYSVEIEIVDQKTTVRV